MIKTLDSVDAVVIVEGLCTKMVMCCASLMKLYMHTEDMPSSFSLGT